jgi:hypothetical protein
MWQVQVAVIFVATLILIVIHLAVNDVIDMRIADYICTVLFVTISITEASISIINEVCDD